MAGCAGLAGSGFAQALLSSPLELSDLNGTNGFSINGTNAFDIFGSRLSDAGDFNADGIDDIIIGVHSFDVQTQNEGRVFILFGSRSFSSSILEVSDLSNADSLIINGNTPNGRLGFTVNSAGDFNADGIDDVIFTASTDSPEIFTTGQSHVLFGRSTGFSSPLNISDLNASNGLTINGFVTSNPSTTSVAPAGDFNGDGIDDVIIGTSVTSPNGPLSGQGFVIYGRSDGFADSVELSDINGSNGLVINGTDTFDRAGFSVDTAGDFNADGLADIVIGAPNAAPGDSGLGQAYVIFGDNTNRPSPLELSAMDGDTGVIIRGLDTSYTLGNTVSSVGDINADGIDDLLLENPGAFIGSVNGIPPGQAFIVFGSSNPPALLTASDFNGSNGVILDQISSSINGGARTVNAAGDINSDGINDILIGADRADPNGTDSGQSFLIYGRANGFTSPLEPTSMSSQDGVIINGINAEDSSGSAVSAAGDFNGDGADDLLVGSPLADINGTNSGQAYVIFGTALPDPRGVPAFSAWILVLLASLMAWLGWRRGEKSECDLS